MDAAAARLPLALAGTAAVAMAVHGDGWTPHFELMVSCALALGLAGWLTLRRPLARPEEMLLLVAVAWALGAGLVHGRALLEAKMMVGSWLAALLLWMGCRRLDRRSATMLLWLLAFAMATVAATVVLQAWGAGTPRVGGVFANPNIAAALVLPMAPITWALARQRPPLGKVAWILPVGLAAAALLSGSRAVMIALPVAVLLGLPAGRGRRLVIVGVVVVTVGVMSWRLTSWPERLSWHRVAIWRAVVTLIADNPVLGIGPAPLQDATGPLRIPHEGRIGRHFHRIGSAESTPLALAVHGGLVGLALVVAAGWMWARRLRRLGLFRHPGIVACCGVMVTLLLVHDQLSVAVVLWCWALLLGSLEAVGGAVVSGADSTGGVALPALLGSLCLGLLAWTLVQPAYARSRWFASPDDAPAAVAAVRAEPWYLEPLLWQLHRRLDSLPAWSAEDAAEAMRLSHVAVRIDPGKSALWSLRGQVHVQVLEVFGPWPDALATARASFRAATDLEPHLPWDWLRWAQLERSFGELERSAALARNAVTAEPNFVRGWLFLARVELDQGRLLAAEGALQQAARARRLRWRAALTTYEQSLVEAPRWQLAELARQLPAGDLGTASGRGG